MPAAHRIQPAVHARAMNRIVTALALCAFSSIASASPPPCSSDAIAQARKLLVFHFGENDPRIEIDASVKELPSIRNPADAKQRFEVLEVWGCIFKGQYRMRLIYYVSGSGCLLMGQEILEQARL
jgi:hypothetical protein